VKNLARLAAPLVAALLAWRADPAVACGFDSPLGNTFTPMHPKSIGVALAVRDAIVAGVIEPATDPAVAGRAGYWRAVGHLTTLQRALSSARAESRISVSVLFIDSGLWARLTSAPNGFAMDVHTDGAKDGDLVVVTGEPVLAAILDNRLSVAAALERGVMALDGEAADLMRGWIAKALEGRVRPVAPGVEAPPIRMFGPGRQ
jgi:hypothetical protein